MRRLFVDILLGAALLLANHAMAKTPAADPVIASASQAVVTVDAGQLQGFIRNGIYTYRGVPYAKAERFMPPGPVPAWQGVRPALVYGAMSLLQMPTSPPRDDLFTPHRYTAMSDDCQFLNVWTPSATTQKKRPVMVWLHGGGFQNGSSIEQFAFDGENLSKNGDVVVVSLNHRLNVVGHLDLSAYGDKYKYSGNLGQMDIVAALQWVKANIAQFGGDAGNVTLFGQSGGGGKILTLMATPAAKGLFHKAIVQSGTFYGMGWDLPEPKASRRIAELTLENLGLKAEQVDQLKTVPYEQLITAANKAMTQTAKEQGLSDLFGTVGSYRWAPTMDGDYVTQHPARDGVPAQSKDIPLLIGTVLNEFNTIIFNDPGALQANNKNTWSADATRAALGKKYGDKSEAVGDAFQKAYPDKKRADATYVDTVIRPLTIKVAKLKADQGGAPVYSYVYTWESPVMDGIAMSWHCAEIPMVFDNVAITDTATGGGKAAYALAHKMSQAWINFARAGNPNHKQLPAWPQYTSAQGATMIFDNKPVVRNHHDAALMALFAK